MPTRPARPVWHVAQKGIVMARRRQLYEGKAKILFEGPEPGTLVQYFKDDATAFNAQKKGVITGKGVLNNRISEYLMMRLAEIGIPTHFVRRLNMREQLIREVEIIPGKGSGQLRKKVERFLQMPHIKPLYHRIENDSKNFGRLFVYFKF